MKIIIISGGEPPRLEVIKRELKDSSFLICADSGANCLYNYEISPNYLVGDFDSINPEILKYFLNKDCKIDKYPKEKDFTDTEIALNKAIELGASEIIFLGCTGSRLDHTLGNIGLLLKCLDLKIKAYLKDDNNIIFMTNESIDLEGEKGKTFSLLAYGNNVSGLTLKGVKYPLKNYELKVGDPLTLSNEFVEDKVSISFISGNLLILYSND